MNTQTHILLAATLLAKPGRPLRNGAVIAGGLVPDLSIVVMWASAKLSGTPEAVIWRDLYWRPEWQSAGAITNSLPLYLALAVAAAGFGARLNPMTPLVAAPPDPFGLGRGIEWHVAILAFSLAAMVHIATDFPVHVFDGHPTFWPFSDWVFQSPVSYWDPRYFGDYVSFIELASGSQPDRHPVAAVFVTGGARRPGSGGGQLCGDRPSLGDVIGLSRFHYRSGDTQR